MSQNSLTKYSNAVAALKEHQAANEPVFKEHTRLLGNVIDAENELRDSVAETKEPVANATHRVTITPQTITQVDPDAVRARQGQTLTPEVIAELIQTTERPPRITISEVSAGE